MQWLSPVLLSVQVISSLSVIVLVLLQQGKGADMGSSFGGGSAGSLFGATGAANFLSRVTKWAAIVFFASTGGLAFVAHNPTPTVLDGGLMQGFQEPSVPTAPSSTGSAVPMAPGASQESAAPTDSAVESVPSVPAQPAPADTDNSAPSTPATE